MGHGTPTDPADAADEGITFAFRNRLMAEKAGRRKEPPLGVRQQFEYRQGRASGGPHRLLLA
jgi:hypothetical protein